MSNVQIISGKDVALSIRKELREKIVKEGLNPGLAIVLVGEDPASKLYVKLKKKAAEEIGIDFHEYLLDSDSTTEQIQENITFLNADTSIHGIVIQLPLPKGIDEDKVINTIDSKKDADGFHPKNVALYKNGMPYIEPALVQTVMRLIDESGEDISGKKAVIVANSPVFAEPLLTSFLKRGATAVFIQKDNRKFSDIIKDSDVIVIALGVPRIIKDGDCKKGAIVIDVGINTEDGEICGDVDLPDNLEDIKNISFITPVPGGVGPVTIAMLLKNVVQLSQK
jgi:methylenetetrahydrofolate dehydrogenase (NADP+)/methenyltetrahydrofolate cyclohydrolase